MQGASIVNGYQTVNVLVIIISIADYSERMKITEYLNSQTPIRDSYFIANHPIVRDLQQKLLQHGYFLERHTI